MRFLKEDLRRPIALACVVVVAAASIFSFFGFRSAANQAFEVRVCTHTRAIRCTFDSSSPRTSPKTLIRSPSKWPRKSQRSMLRKLLGL